MKRRKPGRIEATAGVAQQARIVRTKRHAVDGRIASAESSGRRHQLRECTEWRHQTAEQQNKNNRMAGHHRSGVANLTLYMGRYGEPAPAGRYTTARFRDDRQKVILPA